jgi:hypothetical protein
MTGQGCIGIIASVLAVVGCAPGDVRDPFGGGGQQLGSGADTDEGGGPAQSEGGGSDGAEPEGGSDGSSGAGEAGSGESGGDTTGSEARFCDGGETWSATFAGQPVPAAEDTYVCRGFTLQSAGLQHAIGFAAAVDNAAYVHHMILYRVPSPLSGTDQDCSHGSDWLVQFGWAPGSEDFVLPPEAGFLVGDAAGGQTHFVVEVHYNNPLEASGQVDSSGIDVCLTSDLRPNNAGVLGLGKVSDIEIPPGEPAWVESSTCPSSMTSAALVGGPLTVFGAMPHGHLLARAIRTEQFRNGQLVGDLGRDDAFDFNDQKFIPIDGEVHGGDELVTTCVYDSTSRTTTTHGGLGTQDEMCLNALAYYPALPIPACL